MTERYAELVAAIKSLAQVENPEAAVPVTVTLPVSEDEWYTRPDTVSYGVIALDFEAGQAVGDGVKRDVSHEGSIDLFSLARSGAGWIPLIKEVLEAHCEGSWELNSHSYERETGLFHWEWAFEV